MGYRFGHLKYLTYVDVIVYQQANISSRERCTCYLRRHGFKAVKDLSIIDTDYLAFIRQLFS